MSYPHCYAKIILNSSVSSHAVYVESSEKIEDSWHGLLQLTLQLEKDAASFLRKVKISIAESLQEEICLLYTS